MAGPREFIDVAPSPAPHRASRRPMQRWWIGTVPILAAALLAALFVGSMWRLGTELAETAPVPDGYEVSSSTHRLLPVITGDSALATVELTAPAGIVDPVRDYRAHLREQGYQTSLSGRADLLRTRDDGYDADIVRVTEVPGDPSAVRVDLTVYDSEGWQFPIAGYALLLVGALGASGAVLLVKGRGD